MNARDMSGAQFAEYMRALRRARTPTKPAAAPSVPEHDMIVGANLTRLFLDLSTLPRSGRGAYVVPWLRPEEHNPRLKGRYVVAAVGENVLRAGLIDPGMSRDLWWIDESNKDRVSIFRYEEGALISLAGETPLVAYNPQRHRRALATYPTFPVHTESVLSWDQEWYSEGRSRGVRVAAHGSWLQLQVLPYALCRPFELRFDIAPE